MIAEKSLQSRWIALREALRPRRSARDDVPGELTSGGTVLFALVEDHLPTDSLQTALSLAKLLESELHVVRVLPAFDGINPYAPRVPELLRAVDHRVELENATRAWLEANLGSDVAAQRLRLRHGDPVREVAAHARELRATAIVVAPGGTRSGQMVTALARAAYVPVLVARGRAQTGSVVAAMDLDDRALPVLRSAAELSHRLNARLVAVHNAGPRPERSEREPTPEPADDACERRLRGASRELDVDADIVIAHELNSAHAILREAQRRDGEVIVVGARTGGWLDRWSGRSVTAQVISGAQRSVLVTPLGAPH